MLRQHHFNVEMFGAFQIQTNAIIQKFKAALILIISNSLNYIPGGKRIKNFLNKFFLGKTMVIKSEIEDDDIIIDKMKLTTITNEISDTKHKILYAIANPNLPN